MSLTNGNYFIEIDIAAYITANSECSLGDIVENCILPKLQEFCPECEYVEMPYSSSVSYPCIRLPWADGTVDETSLMFVLKKDKDTTTYTSVAWNITGPSVSNMVVLQPYVMFSKDQSTSSSYMGMTTNNLATSKAYFRFIVEDDTIHMGTYIDPVGAQTYVETVNLSAPLFITKMIDKSTQTEVNATLYAHMNAASNAMFPLYVLGILNDTSYSQREYFVHGPKTDDFDNVGMVEAIDVGKYKSDTLYAYSKRWRSLNGVWDKWSVSIEGDTLWYDNAFTIEGQAFDVWKLSESQTNTSTGNTYCGASICRKHTS